MDSPVGLVACWLRGDLRGGWLLGGLNSYDIKGWGELNFSRHSMPVLTRCVFFFDVIFWPRVKMSKGNLLAQGKGIMLEFSPWRFQNILYLLLSQGSVVVRFVASQGIAFVRVMISMFWTYVVKMGL